MNRFFSLMFLAVVGLGFAEDLAVYGQDSSSFRVVSFNIRYGTAADGDNHWSKRKQDVVATIQSLAPDIMGTQEVLPFQAKYLKQKLPGYFYYGRGRTSDENVGEQGGLFVRRDRFDRLAMGHFWLSKTPTTPGSKDWNSSLPRMATWMRLKDRKTDRELLIVNTHFDHRSAKARQEGAKVIRQQIAKLANRAAVVLTGDFNCGENSKPYAELVASKSENGTLSDTFRSAHPKLSPTEGTFNGFKGKTEGARIDWILFDEQSFKVSNATIDRTKFNGRTPSDHFPVTATLKWK